MRIACLVGNGASIVYNGQLAIAPLTKSIVAAFSQLGGTEAGDTLATFATQVTGAARSDFEGLLGPLDTITQTLPTLIGTGQAFASVPWVAEPLTAATDSLRRLHRLGVATALGLIAERAHGQGQDSVENAVGTLTHELRDLSDPDFLTIATLNYDGLLLASLPEDETADLATGIGAGPFPPLAGLALDSWPLRSGPDLPEQRRIHLLHLHGSLGWLRGPAGMVRKFRIDDLREHDFWDHLADGTADADPVVVLTDRKEEVVATEPFALGYSIFQERLITSDRWCVAGYSFQDAPVNRLLRSAAAERQALGLTPARLLVLDYGDEQVIKEFVETKLAGAPVTISVDGTGLPGSVGGAHWLDWVA